MKDKTNQIVLIFSLVILAALVVYVVINPIRRVLTEEEAFEVAKEAIYERATFKVLNVPQTQLIGANKTLETTIELKYTKEGIYVWNVQTFALIEDSEGDQWVAGYVIQVDYKTGEILVFEYGY